MLITTLRAAAALTLVAAAATAQAGLIGQQVAGSLQFSDATNYFAPASGLVPAGHLNAAGALVTIAEPAIEFGF